MARTKAHYNVSVPDLVNAGILKPDDEVTFEPRRGEVYEREIGAKGELIFEGQVFSSPSHAASKLAGNSRNGWKEIKVRGRALLEYRDQLGAPKRQVVQRGASVAPAPSVSGAKTAIREEILAKLNSMNDRQFEDFVGRLLAELGYADVDVVGRSGDGGVDVTCVLKAPLVEPPLTVVCQVKRHAANIGPSAVGDLRGRWAHRADRLILVNTAGFTQGAREAAGEPGAREVSLVSGEDLARLMVLRGIGVSKEPVVVDKLDEAFFSEFSR